MSELLSVERLTVAQKQCLDKLRAVTSDDGWIMNYGGNIGSRHSVLQNLVSRGLVEVDRGCYRAIRQST